VHDKVKIAEQAGLGSFSVPKAHYPNYLPWLQRVWLCFKRLHILVTAHALSSSQTLLFISNAIECGFKLTERASSVQDLSRNALLKYLVPSNEFSCSFWLSSQIWDRAS
jgi:hypothetical protein